jgi:mannose-6-phosphate isomerase
LGDGDRSVGDGCGGQGGPDQVSEREFSERPWGNYTVLDDDAPDHKVKRLVVHPGKRLSYQRHSKRAEHWFIVAGTAQVTIDGVVTELHPGDSIDIPLEGAHRVANAGDTDVVLIEVQHGSYFGEDDIVRLEDDFGRVDNGAGAGQAAP